MKPAPDASLIRTVSRPAPQYALMALVGFVLAAVLIWQLLPGVNLMLSELGLLMNGLVG